ncbi:MAG: hypothetical protein K5871_03910 [Lachnospiraceae bacterium]|nr:hypothetical protein [Lachnospiraceae bacterium]
MAAKKKTTVEPVYVSKEASDRFHEALLKVTSDRERPTIGTLSEKTVHAVIKNYIEPDEDKQEIPIGSHVADIFTNDEIFEIQTKNLKRLNDKLDEFLEMYKVTVVHPVIRKKKIYWIDPDSGEMSVPRRTSSSVGSFEEAIREVYGIKDHIGNPNLKVRLILIDIDEFRIRDGYGKEGKKYGTWLDKVPTLLIDDKTFERPEDYLQLLPSELPEEFTVADAVRFGMRTDHASLIIAFLSKIGVTERIGKKGRAYLYRMKY